MKIRKASKTVEEKFKKLILRLLRVDHERKAVSFRKLIMQKFKIIHDKVIKRHWAASNFVLSSPSLIFKISRDKIVLRHERIIEKDWQLLSDSFTVISNS